jgi:hypothetical protein
MKNNYFERWLAVKRAIECDSSLKSGIRELLHGFPGKFCFPEEFRLGKGTEHQFARAGVVTLDQREVHLALGIYVRHDPFFFRMFPLQRVIAYHEKFCGGGDPPYFIGPVMTTYEGENMWAFLTEDISEGGRNEIKDPEFPEEYATVTSPTRDIRKVFMDPTNLVHNDEMQEQYLEAKLIL